MSDFLLCPRSHHPSSFFVPEQKPSDNSGENTGALKSFQYAAWFVLIFSISAQVHVPLFCVQARRRAKNMIFQFQDTFFSQDERTASNEAFMSSICLKQSDKVYMGRYTMTLLKLQRQEVATKLFEAHREAPPVSQPVRTVSRVRVRLM